MYEELVKRLRERAAWINFPHHGEESPTEDAKLMMDAADAIAELVKDLERSKDFEAFWQYEAEEALKKFQVAISNNPRWIPVGERLPGTGEIVLVYGKRGGIYTAEHNRNGRWPGSFWKLNSKSHHCDPTHWMPLPYPPKEET